MSVYFLFTGMEKVNFSGGEPFIHQKGRYLGQLVRYCKVQLNLPSVSIVSNGSLITESWFRQYGKKYLKQNKKKLKIMKHPLFNCRRAFGHLGHFVRQLRHGDMHGDR